MTQFNRTLRLIALFFLIAALLVPAALCEHSREELRDMWNELPPLVQGSLFAETPSLIPPYTPGALTDAALNDALQYAIFVRALAGLDDPISLSDQLNATAQSAALLLAVGGVLSHQPEQPEGFPDELFASGADGAAGGNLASFNWIAPDLLRRAIEGFLLDEDERNASVAGHRRWLLNPRMRHTGFGFARDRAGRSVAVMYVLDRSGDADYDMVRWPAPGAFPAELMTAGTPWSVSLNPARYDLSLSEPALMMEELTLGLRFAFDSPGEFQPDGAFFVLDEERHGDGPALLFRPVIEGGYRQNQRWRVTISGIVGADGEPVEPVVYTVEIASLTPIDAADVEIDDVAISVYVRDEIALVARVVPDWADDLSIAWSSDAPEIASVDENGVLTAHGTGAVTVTAAAVNGRRAEIVIEVGG